MAQEEVDLRFARYVLYDTVEMKMVVVSDELTIIAQAALIKERGTLDEQVSLLKARIEEERDRTRKEGE